MNPHPSTYMGDLSKNCGTYIWWAYLLEENDMKWDHSQREISSQLLNIYNIYQVDTSPISFKSRDNWILPSCFHLLYPQQLLIEFDHLMGKL